MNLEFRQAIKFLPNEISNLLMTAPNQIKNTASEIRLRAGRKICIIHNNATYFFNKILTMNEIKECFRSLCGYSIHSHLQEIREGFITISGGHRAGITGTAIYEHDRIVNLKSISSINLRIARQVYGVCDELNSILNGHMENLLIVGPPASGKTTMLKDIVRMLKSNSVSVIDSRGEIAACLNGVPQNNIGNADVFDFWKRDDGIQSAIKTMNPDYIVCDEIGNDSDINAIASCSGAGIFVIATAHGENIEEIKKSKIIEKILKTNAFSKIAFLKGKNQPCKIKSIAKVGEILENPWNNNFSCMPNNYRIQLRNNTKEKQSTNRKDNTTYKLAHY